MINWIRVYLMAKRITEEAVFWGSLALATMDKIKHKPAPTNPTLPPPPDPKGSHSRRKKKSPLNGTPDPHNAPAT
jgi:hypothetical protein